MTALGGQTLPLLAVTVIVAVIKTDMSEVILISNVWQKGTPRGPWAGRIDGRDKLSLWR